jgi:NADH:ubiquinone oxidoreductase subunit 2 (subunit N)
MTMVAADTPPAKRPTVAPSIGACSVAALAAPSMTCGNLAALAQVNLVRLLAYSSIAHAGNFLLGKITLSNGFRKEIA